jgi:hypothetical protein
LSHYYPVTYERDANCPLFCGLSRDCLREAELESYLNSTAHRESVAFSLIGTLAVRFRAESAPEKFRDSPLGRCSGANGGLRWISGRRSTRQSNAMRLPDVSR